MLEALVTSPFFRIGSRRLVEFKTVTANPDFRLIDDLHPFALVIFVARDLHQRTHAAFVVSAVVAVRIHRLTFQSFGFFASGFAVFVNTGISRLASMSASRQHRHHLLVLSSSDTEPSPNKGAGANRH